ncbi:Protein of unknown function [Alteribacillus persepolensis]|uniref:DUF3866 domain-containing protein n=1 Tax=Alteribacillus persepolensis TaxID=568899 RepID=A0A1G7ZPL1_9BACI|nr:DUF3866 family protein [Alteribacillus persepolensis]SDH10618.1 Protein of unknown function [Alteribacillus persepolensis]
MPKEVTKHVYEEKTVQVKKIIAEDAWIQKLETDGGAQRAVLYKSCNMRVNETEKIKVNTTADKLKLGTGGWDIVVSSLETEGKQAGDGHIMKARYTSSQHSVYAVDDPMHPDHSIFQRPFTLHRRSVLLAELHSMLPVLLGALFLQNENQQVGIVLSDEAALPAGLSDHMRRWKDDSRVHVVTTGQAFGGTEEAVTIPNALQWLVLKKDVDVLIISMGHGTVGTNTPYGFSGMALASWANTVGALEGEPVWIPRISFHERRQRHQGLSHHTITPLQRFTYAPSTLVLPLLHPQYMEKLHCQTMPLQCLNHFHMVSLDVEALTALWLQRYKTEKHVIRTMGMNVDKNLEFVKGILSAVKYSQTDTCQQ